MRRRHPAPVRTRTPVSVPADDRPGRRPGDDLVHPYLGHQLDGKLTTVALGQGLNDHQPGGGRRVHDPAVYRAVDLIPTAPQHRALGHDTATIGDVQSFTRV